MTWKFWQLFTKKKHLPVPELDPREIEALRRENIEAFGTLIKNDSSGVGKAIDNVSTPGVVTGLNSIITRTAREQREGNKG
jgi:hypothetical protein